MFSFLSLRVGLHVTEMKFHPGMERVEFHPEMKFNLKENLSLSMMKTYNKIYHFFSVIEIRSLTHQKQTITLSEKQDA